MPEGGSSGKQRGGAGGMLWLCAAGIFRKTEWQLTSFALLADYAGHPIDLDKLDPDKMPDAMIVSLDGDETQLANIIKGLIR